MIPFVFGASFQEDMLALMLRDVAFAVKVARYVPLDKLASEAHQFLFQAVGTRALKDQQLPSYAEIETQLRLMRAAARRTIKPLVDKVYAHAPSDPAYVRAQLTDYARKAQFVRVFQQAQVLWNSGRHVESYQYTTDGLAEIAEIDFVEASPLRFGDFEEFRAQQVFESETIRKRIPTGIPPLDDILQGGLAKGEMGIILADAKRGKSIGLIHMGVACVTMRAGRVAHFVLEGTTFQTVTRYQSRLSRIPHQRIKRDDLTEPERTQLRDLDRRYRDALIVEPMNTRWDYTVQDVQQGIRRLRRRGLEIDEAIVDYGDLLTTEQKLEMRFQQTEVFRGLKSVAMIENVALWTATQGTRPKDEEEGERVLRARNMAESYEKARITDLLVTLNQTARERIMGIMRFHIDMYRDGEADKTFLPIVDFSRMIFYSQKLGFLHPDDLPDWGKLKGGKHGR